MPRRYCPCCKKYTTWVDVGARYAKSEICENHRSAWHLTYITNGAYCFGRGSGIAIAHVDDEGVRCGELMPFYQMRYRRLRNALEREIRGGFDPTLWVDSFPRRTGEAVEQYQAEITAAADQLPLVMIDMIAGYLW